MAIFDCDDPEPRRRHVEALGIRVAHVIRHDDYVGVQLHPRDCRAAMIEFNHTRDGDALDGPYHPAGPGWPATRHSSPVTALIEVEIESPDPDGLAAHWARMLAVPLSRDDHGEARIVLAHGAVRFARVPAGQPECLGGLRIAVADVARTCAAAARRGHAVTGTSFHLGGVRFRIVSPA